MKEVKEVVKRTNKSFDLKKQWIKIMNNVHKLENLQIK